MNKYRELIKNTGIIAVGKMSVQVLNILLLPIYTKYLTTDEYGQADLILTYVTLFLPVISLQIEQALFREMTINRSNQYKQDIIVSTILYATYIAGFVLGICGFIAGFFIKSIYWYFFVLILIASLIFNIYMYYARGAGDNSAYSIGSFVDMAVMILLNIILIGIMNTGMLGMLVSNLAGYVAASVFLICRLHIFSKVSISNVKLKEIPKYLKYSVPMIPNALSWWILSASDKLVVRTFIGVSASGILAIAHKFGNIYQNIFHVFLLAWQESATLHKDDENAEQFFSVVLNQAIQIFGTIGLGIIFAIPFVFDILIDDKYICALRLMPLYVLGGFIGTITGCLGGIYVAYGDSKSISVTTIIGALLNIVINVLLISVIGIYASPISTIMSNIAIALWRTINSRKYIKIRINYCRLFVIFLLFLGLVATYFIESFMWRILIELLSGGCIILINWRLLNTVIEKGKVFLDGKGN